MKKLTLLALALVLATAPAANAAPPTMAQFNALKNRVTKLEAQRRTLTSQVNLLNGIVLGCMGFVQGASSYNGYTGARTTALDYDDSDAPEIWIQIVDPECVETKRFGFQFQRLAR